MSFGEFGVVSWSAGNFSYLVLFDKEMRNHTKKHGKKAGAKEQALLAYNLQILASSHSVL